MKVLNVTLGATLVVLCWTLYLATVESQRECITTIVEAGNAIEVAEEACQ